MTSNDPEIVKRLQKNDKKDKEAKNGVEAVGTKKIFGKNQFLQLFLPYKCPKYGPRTVNYLT